MAEGVALLPVGNLVVLTIRPDVSGRSSLFKGAGTIRWQSLASALGTPTWSRRQTEFPFTEDPVVSETWLGLLPRMDKVHSKASGIGLRIPVPKQLPSPPAGKAHRCE
jgi:hypothetical protein